MHAMWSGSIRLLSVDTCTFCILQIHSLFCFWHINFLTAPFLSYIHFILWISIVFFAWYSYIHFVNTSIFFVYDLTREHL